MATILALNSTVLEASEAVFCSNSYTVKAFLHVISSVASLILFQKPNERLHHLNVSIQHFQDLTAIVNVIRSSRALRDEVTAEKSWKEKIIPGVFTGAFALSNTLSFLKSLDSLKLINLGKSSLRIGMIADLLTGAVCIGDLYRILSTELPKLQKLNEKKRTWQKLTRELEISTKSESESPKNTIHNFARSQIEEINKINNNVNKAEKIAKYTKILECEDIEELKNYIGKKTKQISRKENLLLSKTIIDIALDVAVIALIAFSGIALGITGGLAYPLLLGALVVNALDFSSSFMKEYLTKKLSFPEPILA